MECKFWSLDGSLDLLSDYFPILGELLKPQLKINPDHGKSMERGIIRFRC